MSSRRCRTRRRSFVHGTRTGLRNDHARCRRLRRPRRSGRRSRTRCSRCNLRNCRSTHRRRSGRCNDRRRGRSSRSRRSGHGCGWRNCGLLGYRRSNGARSRRRNRRGGRSGRRHRRRGWPHRRRGRNGWLRRYWRRDRTRRGRNRRSFLLLGDCPQHISGAGDMRQIDLGLDFFFAAQWARSARCRRLRFGRAADVGSHLFGFMVLDGTGMGLLLRHSDER